jgi:signal transduction histidine kinase/DNA-binding response OmpR family regulator
MISQARILRRLKILFGIMVLFTIASCLLLFISQNLNSDYLSKVSLSSRQKALAEELGRKMITIRHEAEDQKDISSESSDFKILLGKWENAQKALITGSDQYGTTASNSNSAQSLLQESSLHFMKARDFLDVYIGQPNDFNQSQIDSAEVFLDSYIASINNVTGKFLEESHTTQQVALTSIIALVICFLLTLALAIILVIRPIQKNFTLIDSEIETLEAKVQDALNAKTEFLSNMSHEVRTPLNGVIGMSELLLQSKLNEEQRAFTRNIHSSAFQLLDLLNNVLDVAKIQAGHSEVNKERFVLSDCIDQVIDLLKPLAHAKKIELMSDLSPRVPIEIISDENRLRQILISLVNNAIKFTEQGEVVIKTELINTEQDFAQIQFSIIDTGIGIHADHQDKIFDSFYQVESSHNKKFGGSGLGLAICQSAAQELGTRVKVKSSPGKGSTFSFTLVAESSGDHHQQKVLALTGLRALVVDDNTTNLKILVKQLSGWGIEVTPFNSPQLVTDIMSNLNKFDFVILDMQMPEMDGHSVAEKIRSKFSLQELPIIVLSSLGEHLMTDKNNFYNAYLTKPAKQSKILDTIVDVLHVSPTQKAKSNMSSGNSDVIGKNSNLRIMLAQDNELSRAVTAKTLQLLGHRHVTIVSSKDVLEKSKREEYDLILMDVNENETDGISTTKQLKRIVDNDDMPVIFGISSNQNKDKALCMQAGMDDILEKPMRADVLQEKINQWLISE